MPVIVFFDEMDSLFRTRGTGISSDIERTIVPQLLAEIDGVESFKNVIVIGASNLKDPIYPAILRPGRLDVKIKIERPNGTPQQIFARYLGDELPDRGRGEREARREDERRVPAMYDAAVDRMYSDRRRRNRFLEVTYQNGDKEVLFFKDFASGAMIENVVRRSKKLSIKRQIVGWKRKGISTPRPSRSDSPGVPRTRRPAQHDEPRRLGEDLGQEGRAHRLRAHVARRRRRQRRRPPDRARATTLVSTSRPAAWDKDLESCRLG